MKLPKCNTPTEPGWYWFEGIDMFKEPVNSPVWVTKTDDESRKNSLYYDDRLYFDHPIYKSRRCYVSSTKGQWYGPIEIEGM